MEKENFSPYSAPPAEFFARERERLRALPPRFTHVESYIDACLALWEARYPQSAGVDNEARRLGNEVLNEVLHKMSAIALRRQVESPATRGAHRLGVAGRGA